MKKGGIGLMILFAMVFLAVGSFINSDSKSGSEYESDSGSDTEGFLEGAKGRPKKPSKPKKVNWGQLARATSNAYKAGIRSATATANSMSGKRKPSSSSSSSDGGGENPSSPMDGEGAVDAANSPSYSQSGAESTPSPSGAAPAGYLTPMEFTTFHSMITMSPGAQNTSPQGVLARATAVENEMRLIPRFQGTPYATTDLETSEDASTYLTSIRNLLKGSL